ncbi:hypothetical protein [Streptomyces lavendulae]|uniref:hypothetical protein n=1 Tax=Streptomyces lavendulae TaxID=1914 RepID=UPI00340F7C94
MSGETGILWSAPQAGGAEGGAGAGTFFPAGVAVAEGLGAAPVFEGAGTAVVAAGAAGAAALGFASGAAAWSSPF